MSRILIIEDEDGIRRVLKKILLEEDSAHEVQEAADGKDGVEAFGDGAWDLVFCDIKMPHMDGTEVLDRMMATNPEVPVIMISGHGDINTAVDCLKKGAFDYLPKPPDLNRLLSTVRNALDKKSLVQEVKTLKKKVSKKYTMVGDSAGMQELKSLIEKVAPSEARVLITGPNGSGKELVAHHIHEKSERSGQPLIEVNCAAIPSELIESELFGHKKGAFTGASTASDGIFKAADGGTLLLDEVSEMSMPLQAKLLRVLQEKSVVPLGASAAIPVDVRTLATSNRNIPLEIRQGRFREDLYFRLNVFPLATYALNDRPEDIIPITAELLVRHHSDLTDFPVISGDALKILRDYAWPGNVRELENVIQRATVLKSGSRILAEDIMIDRAMAEPEAVPAMVAQA